MKLGHLTTFLYKLEYPKENPRNEVIVYLLIPPKYFFLSANIVVLFCRFKVLTSPWLNNQSQSQHYFWEWRSTKEGEIGQKNAFEI